MKWCLPQTAEVDALVQGPAGLPSCSFVRKNQTAYPLCTTAGQPLPASIEGWRPRTEAKTVGVGHSRARPRKTGER